LLNVKVDNEGVRIKNLSSNELTVAIYGEDQTVKAKDELLFEVIREKVTLAKVTLTVPPPLSRSNVK
jgi:DNA-directed RNA polymerase subunit L